MKKLIVVILFAATGCGVPTEPQTNELKAPKGCEIEHEYVVCPDTIYRHPNFYGEKI